MAHIQPPPYHPRLPPQYVDSNHSDNDNNNQNEYRVCGIALTDRGTIRMINTDTSLSNAIVSVIYAFWGSLGSDRRAHELQEMADRELSPPPSKWSLAWFNASMNASLVCEGCMNGGAHGLGHIGTSRPLPRVREIDINGRKLSEGADESLVGRQRLLVAILKCMIHHGWSLIQASSASKRVGDHDMLLFESTPANAAGAPAEAPVAAAAAAALIEQKQKQVRGLHDHHPFLEEVKMFSIMFNDANKIRLVDGPPALNAIVKNAINLHKPNGVQSWTELGGVTNVRLRTNRNGDDVLCPSGVEAMYLNLIMVEIVSQIRIRLRYRLYTSVDVNMDSNLEKKMDTWIFREIS
ncbi:hypothetical protein BG004_002682 [Podila humilis]|nr:hypothetical protein BG004_002682 [Podila humilis]